MVELIRLYDQKGNACNPITQFTDLTIVESLNTLYTVEFSIPLDSDVASEVEIEGFLECDDKKFTIKEITKSLDDNEMTIYGIGECDGLKYTRCFSFTAEKKTAGQALTAVLEDAGTGWTWAYGSDDYKPTHKRTLKTTKSEAQTVWAVIQKIIDKWNVEIEFDCVNHKMKLYKSKRLGQQSVLTVFYEDLNLEDFERTIDSNDVVNNVIAYGATVTKDKKSTTVNIKGATREDGSTVDVLYVNEVKDLGKDEPTINKAMRGYYLDTQETDTQDLYDAAVEYLEDNCNPAKSYTIKISDLTEVNENYAEFYDVAMGDTIGIASHTLGARYNLRVVKITRHPNEVDATEIELSNKRASVATSTAKERQILNNMIDTYQTPMIGDTMLVANNAISTDNVQIEAITSDLIAGGAVTYAKMGETTVNTLMENAVASVQENLENASGFLRMNYNDSGQPTSLDAVDSTNTNNLFRFYAGGLYFSTDGGTTFSRVAIDSSGNIVATNIASGSLIANSVTFQNISVTGGSISLTSSSASGGEIVLKYGTYTSEMQPRGFYAVAGTSNTIYQANAISANGTLAITGDGLTFGGNNVLTFNSSDSGTMIRSDVYYSGSTISSGSARDVSISASKSGYTPIGIVGTHCHDYLVVKYAYLSGSTIVSRLYNTNDSDCTSPYCDYFVLYAKS